MIDPRSKTVDDIFSDGQNRIIVPNYQRNFDWGKDEVQELMSDLEAVKGSEVGNLFLGTFVFDNSIEGELKVVDGQQRLTTLAIILLACRAVAKKNKQHPLVQEIQKRLTFTDSATGEKISERITVSSSIAQVFQYICNNDWDGEFPLKIDGRSTKRQVNKIKPVYDYVFGEIKAYKAEELSEFLRALYKTYVIAIVITDEMEAFDIFERTNARGLDLNVADLLKNYLFANTTDTDVEEKWNEIVVNSENTLQRMLKYFWVTNGGYVQKKNLYRNMKAYGKDVGSEKLTDDLYKFSRYYRAARSLEDVLVREWLKENNFETLYQNEGYCGRLNRIFEALKLFQVTQAYPLIYSIFSAFKRSEQDSTNIKALLQTLELIEKYHFVNNVICERVGNEVEKLYAEMALEFSTTSDFKETTKKLVAQLRSKKASSKEFIPRFSDLGYRSDTIPLLHYIFDRINNVGYNDGQWVPLYNPDKSLLKRNFNVEHFLPQTPAEVVEEDDMNVVDNIGNLLVISRHSNSSFGNFLPKEKIEMLKDPKHSGKLQYLKDFISEYEKEAANWGKETITKRAEDLATIGYEKVWNF